MENVKTFLESSTIHGLAYIATGRKYVRLLWVLVVIAGFTGAGVLILSIFSLLGRESSKDNCRN